MNQLSALEKRLADALAKSVVLSKDTPWEATDREAA